MAPPAPDVLDPVIERDHPQSERALRGRRALYALTSLALSAIMLLAVLDGFGIVDAYGVDSATVTRRDGGYELSVRYGTLSRPGLATPFDIEVTRDGGFDGPVTVGVSHDYLRLFDENGLYPTPSAETTSGDLVLWEFDPPEGDTLSFSYDARIEPASQQGEEGMVAILEDGAVAAVVTFRTRLRP